MRHSRENERDTGRGWNRGGFLDVRARERCAVVRVLNITKLGHRCLDMGTGTYGYGSGRAYSRSSEDEKRGCVTEQGCVRIRGSKEV